MTIAHELVQRWNLTHQKAGWSSVHSNHGSLDFKVLREAYNKPPRAYHTIFHIDACFRVLDRVFPNAPPEVEFALWFHDAIYDTHSLSNEEESADFAALQLDPGMGWKENFIANVRSLILATKHNALPKNDLEAMVVDVDLSILGEDKKTFDYYERQIREEYSWVRDEGFKQGRINVLQGFLDRDWIYSTKTMRQNGYEGRAQENLRRSLAALGVQR